MFFFDPVYLIFMIPAFILMGIVVVISALPLGIGLIWTLPMCICLYGKLFNTVFPAGRQGYTAEL